MKDTKKILIILAIIVVAIVAAISLNRGGEKAEKWNGVAGTSLDVALEFYTSWVATINAEDYKVAQAALLETAPLAESLKTKLANKNDQEADPVACRAFDEVQTRTQIVFEREDTAQYIMQVTKGELTEGYAVVDLVGKEGQWQIQNIACAMGDVAPEMGEFSYEQEGTLVKDSIPAPYDNKFWHILFQADGQVGITPLIFNADSKCMLGDKVESCEAGYLFEGKEVKVYGQMTELGAEVGRVETK
ncbi:hypothetical protein A3C87_03970 [Candidatus Kaiserbacteria bacterium RIFCSPHIGHO2_02_FULL_49_34]|uniref:Uncharacterized protein n=1 Tax=Candidatus Kaiserbacteria bacterium RIFCSPHIGHO2_02_FULL_49_34 TaxID=1798491 RepID=A0A1F6DMI1_9BACT|nr:MAG: hypothetical protein A3C87_03970 [Candidatus Kaiserbacteria bacterium RIFCSPHIGHO2_02_FULL_49_34]